MGVEEELFVLDRETLEPRPWPVELFEPGRIKPELFAAVVELTTGICRTSEEAVAELAELRAEARRRAAGAGLVLAAAGTWPTALSEEQDLTPDSGYLAFAEYGGSAVRRQFCAGLHVHVGVASPAACMARLEAVLPWLPLVLALSANSPYVARQETGLASSRAETLRLLPRTGAPPVFSSFEEWEGFAERLVALGLADQTTRIWWDVRPHPRLGTLELRAPDQPTRAEATAAFVALLQGLVAAPGDGGPADRGLYDQNRWAAARFGREAQLVHPNGTRLVSVPELLDELLEGLGPTLRSLGCESLLAPLSSLDQAGMQLAVGRDGGLRPLCERLVALTYH